MKTVSAKKQTSIFLTFRMKKDLNVTGQTHILL